MSADAIESTIQFMQRFLLYHRHRREECAAAFAAWSGFASPLRHRPTIGSCRFGGHEIWWELEARSAEEALGTLPDYVAARTTVTQVTELEIG